MTEAPARGPGEFEIQLGHLCNNRCVFCVSGQLTRKREAPLLEAAPLIEQLRSARSAGYRRVTLLGGEPTIQPAFLDVAREAVDLAFDEIVVFSNGSKPSRTDVVDRVLATGGRFEWRLSFQGATREAHERTTRRKGSFDQLLRTAHLLRERGQKVTINTCVVATNFESLPAFAELLVPLGVSQLHVDMLNPYDTGTMSDEEVRAIQPRYSELAAPLARMIERFPADFDVNVGNLPFCAAPRLSPWIHHGGQATSTVTANDFGERALSPARNKYLVKGDRKRKLERCRECVLEARCGGIFESYLAWHGDAEVVPVSPARLREIDPEGALVALHAGATLQTALRAEALPPPLVRAHVTERDRLRALSVRLEGDDGERLELSLDRESGGHARSDAFSLRVTDAQGEVGAALAVLWARLEDAGMRSIAPPGTDALFAASPRVAAALRRVRDGAPFGALRLVSIALDRSGRRADIHVESPIGERAELWLVDGEEGSSGGYHVELGGLAAASDELRAGLRELLAAIRGAAKSSAAMSSAAGDRPRQRVAASDAPDAALDVRPV